MQKQVKIMLFVLWLVGFLAVASLASFSVVNAQEPTVTPSPSVSPTVTPTVFSVSNDCPEGDPVGWGVYTPSALWMLECAHCVNTPTPTATIVPTLDATSYPTEFSGTATAQYLTGTPTVTPLYTPTPSSVYPPITCAGASSGLECQQVNSHTVRYYGEDINQYPNGDTPRLYHQISEFGYVYYRLDVLQEGGITYCHIGSNAYYGFHTEVRENVYDYLFAVSPVNGADGGSYLCEYAPVGSYSGVIDTIDLGTREVVFIGDGFAFNWFNSFDWQYGTELYVSSAPIPENPLVTPTPSPVVNSICYSVVPDDTEYFGFDLFQPDGELNCDMGWGSFTVGSFEIPAVEICFQPSRFGVITLFGNDFEVGIFALVVAAAFLYRYFRTSS